MVSVRVKARDAWWTVLVIDPLAGWLVRLVYPLRRVTPNRLTALSVVIAVAAVVAFASGGLVAGALLFQASFVVDCMDGKLAFTRRQSSPLGGFYDVAADTARFGGCVAALAYAAAPSAGDVAAWAAVIALYPAAHFGVIVTGAAWPEREPAGSIEISASPRALLRSAPSRLGAPGSTVDAEAIAFTLAPLAGRPLLGLLIATLLNGAHLAGAVALRGRRAAHELGGGA